jgi:hypothetical protein
MGLIVLSMDKTKTGTGTIISGPSFEIKMSDLPGGIPLILDGTI